MTISLARKPDLSMLRIYADSLAVNIVDADDKADVDNLRAAIGYIDSLLAERDGLAEVVARLPRSKDGVPIVPGVDWVYTTVYISESRPRELVIREVRTESDADSEGRSVLVDQVPNCWSSREAYAADSAASGMGEKP